MNSSAIQKLLYSKRFNANKLTSTLGCAYSTAWRKMKDPSLFTVQDLMNMDACGVASLEELFDAIKEMKK